MKNTVKHGIIERMYLKTNTESYPEHNNPSTKKDQQKKKKFSVLITKSRAFDYIKHTRSHLSSWSAEGF